MYGQAQFRIGGYLWIRVNHGCQLSIFGKVLASTESTTSRQSATRCFIALPSRRGRVNFVIDRVGWNKRFQRIYDSYTTTTAWWQSSLWWNEHSRNKRWEWSQPKEGGGPVRNNKSRMANLEPHLIFSTVHYHRCVCACWAQLQVRVWIQDCLVLIDFKDLLHIEGGQGAQARVYWT